VRVLAVSFALPPVLYPQAIQIGRLLEGCAVDLMTVCGRDLGASAKPQGKDFGAQQRFIHRIELSHRARLRGLWHRLAVRLLPFYGRAPDEYLDWSRRASEAAGAWLAQAGTDVVDVMVSFGEPMSDHLVGLHLKLSTGLPWLAHFSDPWFDNTFRKFQPLANAQNRRLEAKVIEVADCVVFTSEETRQLVMRKYPARWLEKAFVLPHSFDPEDFRAHARESAAPNLILRYLGNFYGHRTPFPLFASLLRLAQRNPVLLTNIRVELIGTLSGWMRWHPAIRKLPAGLLAFCDPVPYRRSLELMTSADLLLVIDAPAKNSVFLPSKLVDYIGAGRPILGIVPPGASHGLITALGGTTADPLDAAGIDAALSAAIATVRARRGSDASWGEPGIREQFRIGNVAEQFAAMLEWTIRRGAR
jgi:hypothetical protein